MVYKVLIIAFVAVIIYKLVYKPKVKYLFPVWAPIEIALTCYILSNGGLSKRILSFIRRYNGSLFGITSKHQILVNLPGVDRLMSQPFHTLSAEPVQYTLVTRVFGGIDSPDLKKRLDNSWKDLFTPIEQLFLNDSASTAALERACIPEQTSSFVSFSSDPRHMRRWEQSADVRVLPGRPETAEANLQSLARDFGACIAIPQLYGKDFLDRYPQLLDDLWKFDNDLFPLLMIGIPAWMPFKLIQEARAARSRLHSEIAALSRRIDQYARGERVDFDANMSDVSSAAFERNRVFVREGWSYSERAPADLGALWGQNANTQPVLFWLLAYVYSNPNLLDRLRQEIAPYVILSSIAPTKIASMDIPALSRNCQLLKACIFETYRMANEPTSIRYISRHMTISDGELKHEIKPGTFISAPHSMINRDPSVFVDPDNFVPERFLEIDAGSSKPVARYGRLKPWGAGASMCKGRKFAEKEVISVGAAIISLWNIEPASGTWDMPAMIPGTGVKKPVKDIRVRITRRTTQD
ncbi:putative cytochrome P450 [Lojkania enalia]|uniref:Cytochrome P450 n=1 Tax=Lojkania enalia TaxID=147567 RepID=A0A9P4K6R4_9PLEO|nr:putative cytochrome P450 [Didymosphaeria enalia]